MRAAGAAVARRYAKALLGLAGEQGAVEPIRQQLNGLATLVEENADLHRVLVEPLFAAQRRLAVLVRLAERLELHPLLRNFCAFLVDQRRLVDLSAIRDAYDYLADEEAGRTHAQAVSSAPLAEEQVERIRRALCARTGREVTLEVRVDPNLIAGVVARVGDLVFDGSLRTQLAQVRASLTKG